MKAMLQDWNFIRMLRLVLGIVIVVQGIVARDTLTITLGVLFGGMAVANIGCCGTSGCAVSPRSTDKKQEIIYEEVDSK